MQSERKPFAKSQPDTEEQQSGAAEHELIERRGRKRSKAAMRAPAIAAIGSEKKLMLRCAMRQRKRKRKRNFGAMPDT